MRTGRRWKKRSVDENVYQHTQKKMREKKSLSKTPDPRIRHSWPNPLKNPLRRLHLSTGEGSSKLSVPTAVFRKAHNMLNLFRLSVRLLSANQFARNQNLINFFSFQGVRSVERMSNKKLSSIPLLSKCVSTGVHSMNVPLSMLCTGFYINMREGIPEYGVKLVRWWCDFNQLLHAYLIQSWQYEYRESSCFTSVC